RVEGRLGGAIDGISAPPAVGGDGRNADDRPLARPAEPSRRRVQPRDSAEQVDLDVRPVLLEVVFVRQDPRHDTGRVDNEIEPAEIAAYLLKQRRSLLIAGHIVDVGEYPRTQVRGWSGVVLRTSV